MTGAAKLRCPEKRAEPVGIASAAGLRSAESGAMGVNLFTLRGSEKDDRGNATTFTVGTLPDGLGAAG